MIRAAIFDIDGTLLDSTEIWEEAGARYLHSLGIDPEQNLGRILFSMTIEEGAAYTKKRYRLPQSTEEIRQGVLDTVRDFYEREAQAKDGVGVFLERLREAGIPMITVTAGYREYSMRALKRLGLAGYFQTMLTCSELGLSKREPEIWRRAAEYLRTEPEETWVFEDALHAIKGAKSAGLRTAAVADEHSRTERGRIREAADVYIESWREAGEILELLPEQTGGWDR